MITSEICELLKSLDSVSISEDSSFISVDSESLLDLAKFLKSESKLDFDFLMCITAIDNGKSSDFTVVYNFYSNKHGHSCEVRVSTSIDSEIPSLSALWKSADWHEREAYDMMGVVFSNHPDLKRILLPQDWEGHPLQKNYKVADYYHGVPIPKDKSYWE